MNETTDERETLVNEICNYLILKVSDISDTKNALYIIMSNYEITNRCTEIVELQGNRNEEILKRFLIAKSVKGCTERTIYYYKTSIQYALAQINKNIDNITSDDIRLYIALRMRRDKVTDVTAANELRNLRSFFNWIYGEEIIKKNPITKVDRIKQHKTQKEALTEMEIEKLRMAVRNEREQMIIELLLSTGCRVSELIQIKLEEIEGARVLVHGKGQKDRRVYLNAKAQLSLERYLACRNDENPYLLPAGFGAMLPAEKRRGRRRNNMADWWRYPEMVVKDKPLDKDAIEQTLRKIAKRAGVERANPHKFRRTCATLALRRGMPIEQVSKMLGHEQISTTQIYLDLSEEDLIQAHKKYVL